LLELDALAAGERELDAVVAAALGDQRLRAEERVERELDPSRLVDQACLEQAVEGVMPGIAFVAAELDGAAHVDRQAAVDLDQALRVALVPVVAGPWLVGHVFEAKRLAFGQRDVFERAAAALADGRLEHG